jgi:hypothetical protein
MIIEGQVYRDNPHPQWCFCEECLKADINKRHFADAFENTFGELPTVDTEDIEDQWDEFAEKSHRPYSWDQSDGTRADND